MIPDSIMTKVMFVGPYPPPFAGPEVAMKTILDSPISEKYKIVFLNTNVRKNNSRKGRVDVTSVIAFFRFIVCLSWKLLRYKPRIVYHFVAANRIGWFGRDIWCIIISKIYGSHVISHMRAGHFHTTLQRFNKFEQMIIRKVCSNISIGFVQANCLKNQFFDLIENKKIKTLYNAIDTTIYKNENLLNYETNLVLFLGHLAHVKGYCDILKAIPEVVRKKPEVRFYFAGEIIKKSFNVTVNQTTGKLIKQEDPQKCYQENIKNKFDKNYRYLGVIGQEEKLKILKKCNMLVLPSYSEGFSMSVLEAMAMGKPVICTPVGALSEVIKNGVNGLIVQPGNIHDIRDAILTLLSDKIIRCKIAETNYKYVRKQFTEKIIAEKLSNHFESILSIDY